jgi:antitoxin component YwqK of YwqJK toxin-antitoxin module
MIIKYDHNFTQQCHYTWFIDNTIDTFNLILIFYLTMELVNYQDDEHYEFTIMDNPEGLFTAWYHNGRKHMEYMRIKGRKQGLYQRWHMNGKLSTEITYKNNKRHGVYREWFNNGKLRIKCIYDNDKVIGLYQRWDKNGGLISTLVFSSKRMICYDKNAYYLIT